jgi:hypothetical protein
MGHGVKLGQPYMDSNRKTDWAKIRREWGAMLTLLLTAASIGLDMLSIFPQFRWSIVALISFVTFCYLVWRWISDLDTELNSVTPNIQLQDEISIRDVWMVWTISTEVTFPLSCMASAPFANNPKFPNQHNDVAKARAEITYLDENGKPLFKPITGRWGGLQPSEIAGSDKRILESTDFPNTGSVRWLDLLLKYPEDEYCYAYNNDSYTYARQFFQHPEHQISSKRFFVQVRLKGAHIPDDVWELEVITEGKGDTFQIRKVGEEWQPKVKSQATKNLPQATAKKKTSRKRTS